MRILLVDRDNSLEEIAEDVESYYIVDRNTDTQDGMYLSQVNDYDTIVVDFSYTDTSGIHPIKQVRETNKHVPLLAVTEKGDLDSKLKSLDFGADACITKPVNALELKANISALIRRKYLNQCSNQITVDGLSLDICKKTVTLNGKEIILRRKEYDILEYIMLNKNKVVSKEELLEHVWKEGLYMFSNVVEVHIRNLRAKIERTEKPEFIKTVKGFGYKFEVKDARNNISNNKNSTTKTMA